MKNHSLTQGSIAKGLLFFVIPLFFSNLFQQLYNTIDTILVGHFLGDNALAAMGATAAIFELIVQFSNGCGTGFSIVTARYFGSKNENELKKKRRGFFNFRTRYFNRHYSYFIFFDALPINNSKNPTKYLS